MIVIYLRKYSYISIFVYTIHYFVIRMDNGDNGAPGMHDSFLTAGGQYIVTEGLCVLF